MDLCMVLFAVFIVGHDFIIPVSTGTVNRCLFTVPFFDPVYLSGICYLKPSRKHHLTSQRFPSFLVVYRQVSCYPCVALEGMPMGQERGRMPNA